MGFASAGGWVRTRIIEFKKQRYSDIHVVQLRSFQSLQLFFFFPTPGGSIALHRP